MRTCGPTRSESFLKLPAMASRSISRIAPARPSARRGRGSVDAIGEAVAADKVLEFRRLMREPQRHLADRAVALLGDEHFRRAMHLLEPRLPILIPQIVALIALFWAARRLAAREIIFLAEDEHHHVGVLLDRARFTQVGEHRPLVVALLDGARQLRERYNRDVQFLRQRFQAACDLGDFLDAVLGAGVVAPDELEIVDDDAAE